MKIVRCYSVTTDSTTAFGAVNENKATLAYVSHPHYHHVASNIADASLTDNKSAQLRYSGFRGLGYDCFAF